MRPSSPISSASAQWRLRLQKSLQPGETNGGPEETCSAPYAASHPTVRRPLALRSLHPRPPSGDPSKRPSKRPLIECLTQQGALQLSGPSGETSLERPPKRAYGGREEAGSSSLWLDLNLTPALKTEHPRHTHSLLPDLNLPSVDDGSGSPSMPLLTSASPWRTPLEERKPAERHAFTASNREWGAPLPPWLLRRRQVVAPERKRLPGWQRLKLAALKVALLKQASPPLSPSS